MTTHQRLAEALYSLEPKSEIYALLSQGARPTETFRSRTALQCAVAQGYSLEIIRLLIQKKADVNESGALGETALHLALAAERDFDVVKYLLDSGADVNARSDDGRTPLHYAAVAWRLPSFLKPRPGRMLRGALPSLKSELTKLEEYMAVLDLLVSRNADVTATTNTGWTSLHLVVGVGLEVPKQVGAYKLTLGTFIQGLNSLRTNQQDPPSEEEEPEPNEVEIVENATNHSWAALQYVIKIGRMVAARQGSESALSLSLSSLLDCIMVYLLQFRKEPKSDENNPLVAAADLGRPELQHAMSLKKDIALVQYLLQSATGSGTSTSGATNQTPDSYNRARAKIHGRAMTAKTNRRAAYLMSSELLIHGAVSFLLDKQADVNALTNGGYNPFHVAFYSRRDLSVLKLLIDRGSDVSTFTYDGWNALHWSAGYEMSFYPRQLTLVQFLLDHGADVNSANLCGWTPLHWAAAGTSETLSTLKLLLRRGADIFARTKTPFRIYIANCSAIDLAEASGSLKKLYFLKNELRKAEIRLASIAQPTDIRDFALERLTKGDQKNIQNLVEQCHVSPFTASKVYLQCGKHFEASLQALHIL